MVQTFGDHELDERLYQLRRRGRVVRIEPKVFDVLLHLLRHRDRVVSKQELLDALWPGEAVSDSVLPRCIAAARRAVGDDRSRQRVIQTVHGRGYRFVSEVQETPATQTAREAGAPAAGASRAGDGGSSTAAASGEAPSASPEARGARAAPPATPAPPDAPERRFVGRAPVLERLRAALADARAGRGRVALLVGEPGIGKTRTAEELGALAERAGARWLAGRCYEGEGAPPFWPWLQVLRALLGEDALADALPELAATGRAPDAAAERFEGEQVRFRFFDAVAQLLARAAREQPLAIALDDLHQADADSLELLRFLAGELRSSPVLLLASYRDIEVRRDHPLRALLAGLAREPHCERIALRGLAPGEVVELVQALTGVAPRPELARALADMTEGNPFFVREVAGLLAEEGRLEGEAAEALPLSLPQGVRDVVGRRLDSLSPQCNALLHAAAVIGRELDARLLERVSGTQGEALLELLGEAEAAQVLAESASGPGRYAFRHALLRQTLYEELRSPRRLALHRRVGEALAEHYADRPDAPLAELAHHFFEAAPAGTAAEAVRYGVRAAEDAHARLAYQESARHYERALEALDLEDAPDPARRCELLIALGDELRTGGARDAGRARLAEAAELARRLRRADLLARAAIGYRGFGEMGMPPEPDTRALLEEALDAVGDAHPPLRAQLLARLTGAPPWSLSMRTREALSREAWELARGSEDPAVLTDVLSARYWATLGPDRVEERLAVARDAHEHARALGDRRLALMAHEIDLGAHLLRGDRARAEAASAAYSRLAEELKQPVFRFLARIMQASLAMNAGAFDAAEEQIRDALARGRGIVSFAEQLFVGQVYWLLQERGELARVAAAMLETGSEFRERFSGVGPLVDVLMALARAETGDRAAAREALEPLAAHDFADLERDEHWLLTMGVLADLACRLGDAPRAERLHALLGPYADLFVSHDLLRTVAGSVHAVLGELATLLGRSEEAVAHCERALAAEEAAGARPAACSSRAALARALAKRGQPGDAERARALHREAVAGMRALGGQLPSSLATPPDAPKPS